MAIESWLASIGLSQYARAFSRHRIDLGNLPELTEADLKELRLPIGHRKRIMAEAAKFLARQAPPAEPASLERFQRRQLTVMFCDIVNSTGVSERLGDEDFLEVLRAYRALCGAAIGASGGRIARYIGDGVLAYFGHPIAREEDAERAVRAALAITSDVGALRLKQPVEIGVRIGIATGLVIIGDLETAQGVERDSVVGAIPNLAARLQVLAPPNQVVISDATFSLVGRYFVCEDFGAQALPGFAEPARCWVVRRESRSLRRFVSKRGRSITTPMVGREDELETLMAAWRGALEGGGCTVAVHGEAGIGKSRLIDRFLEEIAEADVILQHYPTSPFDVNSPLYVVKARIRDVTHLAQDDNAETRRRKLQTAIIGDEAERSRVLSIFETLFSTRLDGENDLNLSPAQLKEATFDALLDQFRRLQLLKPVVLVIEDMHWLDPTTVELLELLRAEAPRSRALIVTTSRNAPPAAWEGQPGTQIVELAKLSMDDSMALVSCVLGEGRASPLARQLAARSEGIPLFAEQLARSLMASPSGRPADGPSAIPASLSQLLAAKFDQAGAARELAEAAAVVGRTTPYALLAAVSGLDPRALRAHIDELTRAGVVFLEETIEEKRLVFKHALMRDAAYNGIVRDRRRLLHSRTAAALAVHSPHIAEEQPELLAYHFGEAGQADEAAQYLLNAARRSLARSSLPEAIAHLNKGLDALKASPAAKDNAERRLEFMALLGPALMAAMGPGSGEAEDLYAEAFALSAELPESPNHFAIYWGWWRVARDFRVRKDRADALTANAESRGQKELLLQAHHCQWANQFFLGNFSACCSHIGEGLAIYEQGDYREHASLYGNHDPKVCGHGERSLVYCMQCRTESALDEERRASAWADVLGHQGTHAHAMDIGLMHRYFRGDPQAAHAHAEILTQFGRDRGFADFDGKGRIFQGWARAVAGEPDRGVDLLQEGLKRQEEVSTIEDFPAYFSMQAESSMLAGRFEDALARLTQNEEFLRRVDLLTWMPEILRWKGRALRAVSSARHSAAVGAFEESVALARAQGALLLELRSALDLAQLRSELGANAQTAAKDLESAVSNMREGFALPVAAEARKALARLGRSTGVDGPRASPVR